MSSGLGRSLLGIVILLIYLFLYPAGEVAGNGGIKTYFSPNGDCEKKIIGEIDKAKRSIHIAMFSFTNGRIARALVRAYKQGIKIKVIMNRKNAQDRYSKYRFLKNKGISVKFKEGPYKNNRGDKTGLMHNKFAIIDGKTIITGSYNWTTSAEKWNHENLLVISSFRVAKLFEKEFRKLWKEK